MIIEEMMVEFDKYCPTCKYYEESEWTHERCAVCVENPVNINSVKPVNWEAKDE